MNQTTWTCKTNTSITIEKNWTHKNSNRTIYRYISEIKNTFKSKLYNNCWNTGSRKFNNPALLSESTSIGLGLDLKGIPLPPNPFDVALLLPSVFFALQKPHDCSNRRPPGFQERPPCHADYALGVQPYTFFVEEGFGCKALTWTCNTFLGDSWSACCNCGAGARATKHDMIIYPESREAMQQHGPSVQKQVRGRWWKRFTKQPVRPAKAPKMSSHKTFNNSSCVEDSYGIFAYIDPSSRTNQDDDMTQISL